MFRQSAIGIATKKVIQKYRDRNNAPTLLPDVLASAFGFLLHTKTSKATTNTQNVAITAPNIATTGTVTIQKGSGNVFAMLSRTANPVTTQSRLLSPNWTFANLRKNAQNAAQTTKNEVKMPGANLGCSGPSGHGTRDGQSLLVSNSTSDPGNHAHCPNCGTPGWSSLRRDSPRRTSTGQLGKPL